MRQFGELMQLLGIDPGQAQAIAGAAADWIDSDSNEGPLGAEDNAYRAMQGAYLPANRKMADVSELRAVRGVTPKIYARLKPWICVLPATEPVQAQRQYARAPTGAARRDAGPRRNHCCEGAGGAGGASRWRLWQQPAILGVGGIRRPKAARRCRRTGGRDQPLADADDECDDGGTDF